MLSGGKLELLYVLSVFFNKKVFVFYIRLFSVDFLVLTFIC